MIHQSEVIPVGVVGKSHGLAGEVNINFDLDIDLEDVSYFVFDMDGILVPFFIETYRFRNDMLALVSFDGIDTETGARALYGKTVYVKRGLVPQEVEEESLLAFVGYMLTDSHGHEIGTIDGVDDTTDNILFSVGDHLLPVAALEITEIDHEARTIRAELPDGLLNLVAE